MAEYVPSSIPTANIDLFKYPDIATKDMDWLNRVQRGVKIANASLGLGMSGNIINNLPLVEEEKGRALVNKVYFLHKKDNITPVAVLTLINPDRKADNTYERTVAAYKLLSKRLPEVSGGVIVTPKLLGFDNESMLIVTKPLIDNVSWKTPEPVVEGMLQSFLALSKIKPTLENRKIFPFDTVSKSETPRLLLLNVIQKRFQVFYGWIQKIRNGEVGSTNESHNELQKILNFIDKKQIVSKMENMLEDLRQEVDLFPENAISDMPDQGLSTSDGNGLNFLTNISKSGDLNIGNVDFEGAQFTSISTLVASAIWHPQNRQLFKDSLRNKLINNYAHENRFDSSSIKTFNLLIKLFKAKWIGTVAKNLDFGRANWRQLYGGLYKTREEFILKRELPLLLKMLENTEDVVVGLNPEKSIIYDRTKEVRLLDLPLTGKSPFGEFQRFVAENIVNPSKHEASINNPILENNLAYPFSQRELYFDSNPYLIGKTKKVLKLGDGNYLVVNEILSMRAAEVGGNYSYIMRDKKTESEQGGLIFSVGEEEITASEVQQIQVPESVLKNLKAQIDPGLKNRLKNLTNVLSKLSEVKSNLKVDSFEIVKTVPEADNFYTFVVAHLNNGQNITIKVNRENRVAEDSAGVVYVPRTKDGYMLVRQKRAMIPTDGINLINSKETLEASRGWVSPDEPPLEEFAHEFGLRSGYKLTEGAAIPQDYRTDAANLSVYLIDVDHKTQSKSFSQGDKTDEYFEEIQTEELSGQEIVRAIENGIIRDNFSIYGFSLYMLRTTQELIPDLEKIGGKKVYLQKRFVLQEGKFKSIIPVGLRGMGDMLGETLPNSSSARQVDEVNKVPLDKLKKLKIKGLESVSILKVLENIADGEYDAPTAAALIVGFLKEGYIKYNSLKS